MGWGGSHCCYGFGFRGGSCSFPCAWTFFLFRLYCLGIKTLQHTLVTSKWWEEQPRGPLAEIPGPGVCTEAVRLHQRLCWRDCWDLTRGELGQYCHVLQWWVTWVWHGVCRAAGTRSQAQDEKRAAELGHRSVWSCPFVCCTQVPPGDTNSHSRLRSSPLAVFTVS